MRVFGDIVVLGGDIVKDRIKMIRKEKKITQIEFGEAIGIKGNTVTNYENGMRTPSDAVIKSICRVYNVNEDWLRTGEGEMFNEINMENELMAWAGKILGENDSFKKRFVRMLMTLDEDEWEFIARKAKELAGYDE
jgi:transcriptional regulator with XRE-family HTH domain